MANTNEVSSGIFFDLDNPRPEQVTIQDIAHHLSQICRFNGGSGGYYSVAEHSLAVMRWVDLHHGEPRQRLAALLHDGAETYVGDITTPVKRAFGPVYRELYLSVEQAVAAAFGFNSGEFHRWQIVNADHALLAVEAHHLTISGGESEHWSHLPEVSRLELAMYKPRCLPPLVARAEFLSAYNELVTELRLSPGGTVATYAV